MHTTATSSLLVEARSVINHSFFPFSFVWGRIWMIPGRELWCALALRTITAGWKQGDTDIFISLLTQNIQPRKSWSVVGLKETEFYNWFFKIWQWLLFSSSLFSPPKDRYLLNGIWTIGMLKTVFHNVATSEFILTSQLLVQLPLFWMCSRAMQSKS